MSEWLSTSLPTPTVDHRENLFGTSLPAAGETFYLEQAGVVDGPKLANSVNNFLVGGFNPLKNISQLGLLFPIYGKNMFQTTNQLC